MTEKSIVHIRQIVNVQGMINGFESIFRGNEYFVVVGMGRKLMIYNLYGEKIKVFDSSGNTSEIVYFPNLDGLITNTGDQISHVDMKKMVMYENIKPEIHIKGDYNPKAVRRDDVLIFLSKNSTIRFFNTLTMDVSAEKIEPQVGGIQCLELIPRHILGETYLVVGGREAVEIYDSNYRLFRKITHPRIYSTGFDYVTKELIVGTESSGVFLLENSFSKDEYSSASEGKEIVAFKGFPDVNSLLAYDGIVIAGSYLRATLRIVDFRKGGMEEESERWELKKHPKYVNIVKWRDDRKRRFIVSAGYNGEVHMWENLKFQEKYCFFFQQDPDLEERYQFVRDGLLTDNDGENISIFGKELMFSVNLSMSSKNVVFKTFLC